MPESNSQQEQYVQHIPMDCELSYKDNAWKQFTTIGCINKSPWELWIIL